MHPADFDRYLPVIEPTRYLTNTLGYYSLLIQMGPGMDEPAINWLLLIKWLYIIVALALFFQLIFTLLNFFIKIRRQKISRIGRIHILKGNKKRGNGSFLNYIFLNSDELSPGQVQQVIAHEVLHISLLHSADRMFMKISQIVLWFNPVVYLYARAMAENHEFEVDSEIVRSADKKEYAGLLLHLCESASGVVYNSFSKAPLKKRVTMLFTRSSPKTMKLIYMLALPVLLLSCMAFAKIDTGEHFVLDHLKEFGKPSSAAATEGLKSKTLVLKVRKEIKQVVGSGTFDDGKFYTRVALDDGVYDMIGIRLNGALHITFLPHDATVAFRINGEIHQEDEIANLTIAQTNGYKKESPKADARNYRSPDLLKYSAYIEVGGDFNTATINVKPNPATDALPWQMRNIVIDADGAVEGN
jgi:hypothetical protein